MHTLIICLYVVYILFVSTFATYLRCKMRIYFENCTVNLNFYMNESSSEWFPSTSGQAEEQTHERLKAENSCN